MDPFQTIGVACLVAAIIGGGLKAAGFEIGAVKSLGRQVTLGFLGLSLFAYGTPEVRGLTASATAPVAPMVLVATTPTTAPTIQPTASVAPPTATVQPPTATVQVSPTGAPAEPTAPPTAPPVAAPTATAVPASAPAAAPPPAQAPALRATLPANRPDGPLRR